MVGEQSDGSAQPTAGTSITRRQYDWERTNPSTAVIETVAEARGCDPTSLDPLHDDVDPDALDALLEARRDGRRRTTEIRFRYDGLVVELDGRGALTVRNPTLGD